MLTAAVALLTLVPMVCVQSQQIGTNVPETHPPLTVQSCTNTGGCQSQQQSIVLDANWRWLHNNGGFTNCYTGNTWNTTLCPNPTACAQNCALDGADYAGTYGITTSGDTLSLNFVTQSAQKNVGSRVSLLADESHYQVFKLKNKELAFDVDVSQLPCGVNGALYFSQMPADGGLSQFPNNKAGAKFGTGYCDAQCPHDLKFINGQANVIGWTPSTSDPNSGAGQAGSCCAEMDIWEANSNAAAFTPHPCLASTQTRCTSPLQCGDGDNRGNGLCDKDGCDFNSFRMGDQSFLGPGKIVDTKQKFTVVTQFLTSDNTTTGKLKEIRRLYVQDGKVIQNSKTNIPGMATFDSVTDDFCSAQKTAFGDTNSFATHGGLSAMSSSFDKGMVLVMSIWDDHEANMLWLDSAFPTSEPASAPGVARGACATDSGVPANVESQSPGANVTFSNIKFGDIGSTFMR
ncbi:hypothetical protein HGRIS_009993 [Hohenbuehelia grisea]|uniref:Glucanase n=1 Tax=Hohenbuehelia grisea TaxID=104357 RepID=A0ABR3J2Y6_9AGAR